jgi:3-deoxy-D-manno-octulosonate 8-phosphate phosphatase (KDO 8-P phosphatase)
VTKLDGLKKELGIESENIGYIGSEVTDIPVMKKVGFAIATSDAIDEVKEIADYITTAPGGRGPIREVCEFILRSMGKWEEWVEKVTKMGYK